MKKFYFLSGCLFFFITTHSQYSRYIVRLKDKNGSSFTLSDPLAYLSGKAVERRTRQNIIIDSTDLPVSLPYLDSIRSVKNVTILNISKWLNQVCIRTTDADALAKINSFSFVSNTAPVGARLLSSLVPVSKVLEQAMPSAYPVSSNRINAADILNYGNTYKQIHIHQGEYLHNRGFTGNGISIAILDAGFFAYKTNPVFDSVRLQNRVLKEWDFVSNEQSVNENDTHGMYCFSILASNRPGSMVGSAPAASFFLFRTEDSGSEYPVEEQNWAAAAELADSLGADMISSSLGYADFDDHSFDHSYADRNGNTSISTRAADLAAKKGMIVMNSAGNSGNDNTELKFVSCPADGDSVVAVGAVDVNGNLAVFSSWGPNGAGKLKPDIVSVGLGTTIAGTDGNPSSGSGTSFSNPNVAGLIACLWQAFPEFSNMEIIDAVDKSSDRYRTPDNRFGYGIPDFRKAFTILISKSFKGSITNDHCVTTLSWTGKDDPSMHYDVEKRMGQDTGFTRIATVKNKSPGFSLSSYSLKDTLRSVISTAAEYRIKQIIQDDTSLVMLDQAFNITGSCNADNSMTVSPNPFKNSITLTINTAWTVPMMSITLYNVKGQRLYYYEGAKGNGLFSLTIPASRFPAGTYFLTVRDKRSILFSKKIIK